MSGEVPPDRVRWSAVGLIYAREMRDQFRDRRTVFTILILPVLLYPLVGSLMMQITQFSSQPAVKIAVVGEEHLSGLPLLIEPTHVDPAHVGPADIKSPQAIQSLSGVGIAESVVQSKAPAIRDFSSGGLSAETRFAKGLDESGQSLRMTLYRAAEFGDQDRLEEITRRWITEGIYDVVLFVPAGLQDAPSNESQHRDLPSEKTVGVSGDQQRLLSTKIELIFNATSATSNSGVNCVIGVLQRWRDRWVQSSFDSLGLAGKILRPFELDMVDLAKPQAHQAAMWSKLLPMVMLIWAMTGAFYPAIDMVAGEKERGTLETLLCSPALRSEIVWGKLAAVTTFSMLTAMLNTASLLTTGAMVVKQMALGSEAALPQATVLWLLIALLPLSALFSAIALGLSALARSSKEGQYYLMPMMMVILPLVMLPTMPGMTLGTGTSLIPVTGMFLLVRALVEEQYALAMIHVPIVAGVTIGCVCLALRWVQSQFENESVLFHGGLPWNGRHWMASLRANRQRFATPGQAYTLAVVILVGLFFGRLMFSGIPDGVSGLAQMILGPQLVMILLPTVIIAILCTHSPLVGLRLRLPGMNVILFSIILGFALHPAYMLLARWVMFAYPISESALASMHPLTDQIAITPWLSLVLLMAVTPAICEELAFRGFIFGGLLRDRQPLRAILISAVVFGISHGVLQQSISATVMGILLGWVSWRTNSVLPTMLIHVINNGLSVSLPRIAQADFPGKLFIFSPGSEIAYQPMWSFICITFVMAILVIFGSLRPDPAQQASSSQDESDSYDDDEQSEGASTDPTSGLASIRARYIAMRQCDRISSADAR